MTANERTAGRDKIMTSSVREIAAPLAQLRRRTDSTAWYRQFWPWFLISLPAASVIFSIATLVVAVRHADSLVRDDWYEAGRGIDRDFARERAAAVRGLHATVAWMPSGILELRLEGAGAAEPQRLELAIARASDASRDRFVELIATAPGKFVSTEPLMNLDGPWDAALSPPDSSWRIAQRIEIRTDGAALLVATR